MALLANLCHPDYATGFAEWLKWRAVYDGGDCFLHTFLEKFSDKESDDDFKLRKRITPIPEFAKAAITDIKNGLFARLSKVSRAGGPKSFQAAVRGQAGGVDLHGSSMNHFVGECILPQLLPMGKVGVFVDRKPLPERPSLLDAGLNHPYLYYYRREDILNWHTRPRGDLVEFDMLLLRECRYGKDPLYGLANGVMELYRLVELVEPVGGDPYVQVRFFRQFMPQDQNGNATGDPYDQQVDEYGNPTTDVQIINLPSIPFHCFEIDSLLKGIANHQIALLNTESSDIQYILQANFPIYTEEFNRATMASHLVDESTGPEGGEKVVDIGIKRGRMYAQGTERPSFIFPSSEPITASMQKQTTLKDDIRTLVNLALSSVRPKFASADSKEFDERGLEAGLASIGLTLEHGEQRIADFWAMYEGMTPATVSYPERYSLKSAEDRRKDAEQLAELKREVPSTTYRKELDKQIAVTLLGDKLADEVLDKVLREIDEAVFPTADPDDIRLDHDAGLVSDETASLARGWPKGEAEKGAKDKAGRLALAMAAQTSPNAGPGTSPLADGIANQQQKAVSQSPDNNVAGQTLVRGKGQ